MITDICWALLPVVFITNVCVINCIQLLILNVPQAHLFKFGCWKCYYRNELLLSIKLKALLCLNVQ